MTIRRVTIVDYGQDYGFSRYNAMVGSKTIAAGNDLEEIMEAVANWLRAKK